MTKVPKSDPLNTVQHNKSTMFTRFERTVFLAFLLVLALPKIALGRKRKDGNPLSRSITIINRSGARIDFYWVNPTSGELAESTTEGGVVHGGDSTVSSYIGHKFEVHEIPKKKTGKCLNKVCQITHFTVTSNEDQSECSHLSLLLFFAY